MKRFVVVDQPGSSTAPHIIVDLEHRLTGVSAISPAVLCSGSSYTTLWKLAALMNEHWA